MIATPRWGWTLALAAGLLWAGSLDGWAQDRGRGDRKRPDRAPKQGDAAPEFTLARLDGKGEVSLAEFRDKQPVVLIFGSYT